MSQSLTKLVAITSLIALTLTGCYSINKTMPTKKAKVSKSEYKVKRFSKIKVNDAINNIVIKPGNSYCVQYQGKDKNKLNIKNKDESLILNTKSGFTFNKNNTASTITIEVPRRSLEMVEINASNGNVKLTNLTVKSANIEASNGNIVLNKVKTKLGAIINSSNGNLTTNQCNFLGYSLTTSNGNIHYQDISVGDSFSKHETDQNLLRADLSNGDIYIK